MDARTLLFVPGDRPDRFDKAAAAGADLVVLDLEDAVAPDAKDRARDDVVSWLRTTTTAAAVRVNAHGTPWHDADLAALSELLASGVACTVMLPKAQDPAAVAATVASLGDGAQVVALLETARGVLRAEPIAAVPGVVRLALGTYDLATELGVDPEDVAAMASARGALVLASAAAGLAGPVDGVTGDVRDADRLVADVRRAAALGFAGKLCIHPAQVAPTAATFAPDATEVAWAQRVVTAAEAAGDGVLLVDGRMVDLPVVDRARRILTSSNTETGGTP
ncbi:MULTISPECIES: HpcH/HpaI aldolase/citrate lyase family protein [unclassified Nocardioides]|uniref:HpcH/HpaI aldolase/citrate lyase family protein n=1 Tax=unclassified Nocardioides TaxID=2615069 RepID=UPI0007027730|nr:MULTISPECIES: CoA ester lyase [unclassified Nocardioides]KQZ75736.1 aldolase [Nocardioides sp. Root151]KRF14808.1 aldolase [Nocardioides sp. Soil796]